MSVETITKEMYRCKCERDECKYEWETATVPHRCPKCKSRRWNRKSRFKTLTFNGKTQTLSQWTKELGFAKTTIPWRLRQGWPIEQVLSKEDWRHQYPEK